MFTRKFTWIAIKLIPFSQQTSCASYSFAMYIKLGNMFKLTFAVVDKSEDLYAWWKTIYQAKRPTGIASVGGRPD